MLKARVRIFLVAGVAVLSGAATEAATPRVLSVADALTSAESVSPDLKAAQSRENQARDSVKRLESVYYPSLDLEAVQSYGYPGSNGALGVSGLISSPFRSGPGAEVVSKLSLVDPSRWRAVGTAREKRRSAEAETRIVRYKVDQATLQIYFDGVRYRGESEAWATIGREADKVKKSVDKFVRAGQHSPVEQYLIDDQVQEAAMAQAVAEKKYQLALRRLALMTGLKESDIQCPSPSTLSEETKAGLTQGTTSPFLDLAAAEARTARALASERSAERYPRVTALASAGDVSRSRVVQKDDYSAGVGLMLPIFEGGRISSDIHLAEEFAAEKENDELSTRLQLDELNARFDEAIESSRIKMSFLTRERSAAGKALSSSRERYLSFLGPLVEVREAIRNMGRIEEQISDVTSDLLLASGSKALLNGGVAKR